MKKFIFIGSSLIFLMLNANARINNNYRYNGMAESMPSSLIKIQSITNDAITLNVRIDDIDISDPRIKSVIEYAKSRGNGVSIVFFAPDNLRYVKKINELFKQNNIFTDTPELTTPHHLNDLDLIKIYVINKEQQNGHNA